MKSLPVSTAARGAARAALGVAIIVGTTLLSACSTTPNWDWVEGDAVRAMRAQQAIDPAAARRNAGARPEVDGRTTREAMARVVDSYRTPPPSNVINIGVGGGSSGN